MRLRSRIILFAAIIAIVPLLITNGVAYVVVSTGSQQFLLDEQSKILDAYGFEIGQELDRYRSLALFLSNVPEVHGIGRSLETGDDPETDNTLEDWRAFFTDTTQELAAADPFLLQARYITPDGLEVVRVDQSDGVIQASPVAELQDKSQSNYVSETLSLSQGQTFVSDFDLNVEGGAIQVPYTPVIRVGAPVFSRTDSSVVHGMVIINVRFRDVLEQSIGRYGSEQTILVDQDGNILFHPDQSLEHGRELNLPINYFGDDQSFRTTVMGQSAGNIEVESGELEVWSRVQYDSENPERYWTLFSLYDEAGLLSQINLVGAYAAGSSLLLMVGVIITAIFLARRIADPIVKLSDLAEQIGQGSATQRVPSSLLARPSEIGALARSIEKMRGQIAKRSKGLESAATESASRFQKVFDSAPTGFALVSLEGDFLEVNQSLAEIVGYSKDELVKKTFQDITYKDDLQKDLDQLKATLDGKIDGYRMEKRYIKKDGELVWILLNVSLVRGDTKEPLYFISQIQDISDRKEYEQRLEGLNDMKNKFIRVVSHQLRTPLTSIRWNLENLASEELGKLSSDQKSFIRSTAQANDNVIERISDMVTALDIEEGRATLEAEQLKPEDIYNSVITKQKGVIDRKELACDCGPFAAKISIKADRRKLETIFRHLVQNAIEYTPNKGTIKASFEKTASGGMRFVLSDSGIGIPKTEQVRIYEKFFRGSNAFVQATDHSGLGLYIVKEYVRAHGGTISVESAEGKGTTFTVELPPEPTIDKGDAIS